MDPNMNNPDAPNDTSSESSPISPVPTDQSDVQAQPSAPIAKKRFGKLGMLPIIAGVVVLLLGGSAAAYLGVIVPNRPENVLKASVENTLKQKQVKFSGKLSLENLGENTEIRAVNFDISGQSNVDQLAFQTELNITASGVKLPIEIRKLDSSLFFKVGDLSTIKSLAQTAVPEYGFIIDEVNKKLADQWIEVDETLLKQAKADCALNTSFSLTEDDIELIQKRYAEVPFADVKSISSDTVNGRAAYKYEIEIVDNKGAEYFKGLEDLSVIKKVRECGGDTQSFNAEDLADDDNTPLTIWIDKGTKTLSKIASHTTSQDEEKSQMKGALEMTFQFGEANIVKPEGAKPAMEVFSDLQSLFMGQFMSGTGVDLQSLESESLGSFDF